MCAREKWCRIDAAILAGEHREASMAGTGLGGEVLTERQDSGSGIGVAGAGEAKEHRRSDRVNQGHTPLR